MNNRNRFATLRTNARGAGLLDVLLAIVIFVVGMLALASLQGNLTRSSADGKARTVATNLVEEIIEGFRTFDTLRAAGACPTTLDAIIAENAYQCVGVPTSNPTTIERDGFDYEVSFAVDDYYFLPDAVSVTTETGDLPANRDTTISDFKYVEITVNWGENTTGFLTYDEQNPTNDLGSGTFTLSSIIPSTPPMGAALIAAEEEDAGTPPVNYTPGERPDIIRIDINGEKFKESTTPQPDVIRRDELVETWFDVVTYNQSDPTIYIRREEFLVVTCECTLKQATPGTPTGLLPTVWNGASYTTGNDGNMVSKNYGISANPQQSYYCDTCCRDHHDPSGNPSDDQVYDPDRSACPPEPKWSESGGLNGDHVHYGRARRGGLEVAGPNSDYVEACRMVRKDGFMRVAQDFRQEGLLAFPAGYLDTLAGAEAYSTYVTDAVTEFYDSTHDLASPPGGAPGDLGYDFPGDRVGASGDPDDTDTTALPLLGLDQQQLRSRALYFDKLSGELEELLTCAEDGSEPSGYSADPEVWRACGAPGYTDVLQVLPFYEIQTTWLSKWISDPQGTPVSVTSESVNDNNTHSRGLAVLENSSAVRTVDVETDMHRGNVGLTATDSITLAGSSPVALLEAHLYVDVNGGDDGEPPPSNTYSWNGIFTSAVNRVDAQGVTITPNGSEFCSTHGTNEITCATPLTLPGSITFTGYSKKVGQTWIPLWICLNSGPTGMSITNSVADGVNNSTTLSWNVVPDGTSSVALSIESSACSQ